MSFGLTAMAPPMDVESPASVERRSACLSASLKLKNISGSGYAGPVATPAHNPPFPSHKSSAILMLIAVTLSSLACPAGLQRAVYSNQQDTLTLNSTKQRVECSPPASQNSSRELRHQNRKLG